MRHVHSALRRLRRASIRRGATAGLAWGVATGVCGVTAGAALLALGWLSHDARWYWIGATLAGMAIALAVPIAFASRRAGHPMDLARRLEGHFPDLRTDVRTALEFSARGLPEDPVAAALATRLQERIDTRIQALGARVEDAAPRPRLAPPLRMATAAAMLAMVGSFAAPSTYGAALRALIAGPEAAERAATAAQPIVAAVDLTFTPPAYTGMAPQRAFGVSGRVRTLEGTRVSLTGLALIDATHAALRVQRGVETERTRLAIDDAGRISGTFDVRGATTWRFELMTADGETVLDPIVREIEIVDDAAPSIDMLEPGDTLEVTPEEVVDLHFVARDDFGLRDVRVMWHFSGDPGAAAQFTARTVPGETHHEEHVPMDLLPLELQPRDEIVVYVEATDGDTVSGAKTGRSRSVVLRVGSADDAHDDVLALKEQVFEQLLALLGDALASGINILDREAPDDTIRVIPSGGTNADRADRVRRLRATHEGWHALGATFDALLAAMREDPLSLGADLDLLAGISDRLRAVVDAEHERLRAIGTVDGEGPERAPYEALARAAADTVATTERAILVVQDLVATHRADDVTRAMAELEQSRERLRELLEAYRDTQDPALRAQIERDLRRLEQRMRELVDRIAAQSEQLPVEHLNADALDPSELGASMRKMGSSLDQLRALLDAGDVDAALEALEALEREMDSIGQELSPLAGAQPETLSEYDQRMGEIMDALGDLEALERSIEEDTQRVLGEMLAERAEAMRERTESALSRMEEELRTLRDALEPGEGDLLGEATARRLADARDALRSLEERLDIGDVAGSLDSADRAMSQLFDAGWELRREALHNARNADRSGEIETLRRRAEEAGGAVRQVQRELSELLEEAAPRPNVEQSGRMRELAERQTAGLGRLRELQERAGEMGERFPSMEGELGPALEAIGEHMESAARRLDERASREALRSENAALEAIEGARQTMQQLTQRQRQRERAQSGRRPEERVEVPEDGESSRAEFRRRVIEAMREEGLDAYEDEIRQYYDRLLE